jgi:putative transposase
MLLVTLVDAKTKIEAWRIDYNQHRPHSSIDNRTPDEYVSKRQENRTSEAAIF